ncbi:MAG TPA: hypothetical protein VEF03_10780 [Candidatus Binataceae bacterium]|nr:hypothetical protein [Candidatus Binataceae bacterium]
MEDGVRFREDGVAFDQYNAGRLAATAQMIFNYRLTSRCLLCGEAKNPGWIAPYYESHPGVAEIAYPVEKNEGLSRQHLEISLNSELLSRKAVLP